MDKSERSEGILGAIGFWVMGRVDPMILANCIWGYQDFIWFREGQVGSSWTDTRVTLSSNVAKKVAEQLDHIARVRCSPPV
jgi:hypothetical protein